MCSQDMGKYDCRGPLLSEDLKWWSVTDDLEQYNKWQRTDAFSTIVAQEHLYEPLDLVGESRLLVATRRPDVCTLEDPDQIDNLSVSPTLTDSTLTCDTSEEAPDCLKYVPVRRPAAKIHDHLATPPRILVSGGTKCCSVGIVKDNAE